MCGRFDLDAGLPEIQWITKGFDRNFKTGEVFPTNSALVLIEENGEMKPDSMIWGFPQFGRKGVIFNARSETALDKSIFRKALLNNRIVIPTTGFYEWKTDPEAKKKIRYRFTEPGQPITWIAGFYNVFRDEQRFTMLTTAANDGMEEYHDRMPVILHADERLDWLEGNNLSDYLGRVPPELNAIRIG